MNKSVVSNLPNQSTTFVGRDRQISEICRLLQDPGCRLLTLVGPGGIGKTRLAIAVAERLVGIADSIVFVPLQAVPSPEFLASAIADAAGISLAGSELPQVQLLNHLRRRRLLLVLDNFEHLLDGTNLLVETLREAPSVKLLITSREALRVREEWLHPVPGLPVPAQGEQGDPTAYGGIQLFADRARQIRHDFAVDEELEPVLAICRAVEGMPLAIELAASWLTVLDCAAIVDRLRHGLEILATPLRNVPERHRSMVAVFDQSWQMLSPEERDTFAQLAVFQGGITYPAAEKVAGASLPIMAALVAKTLVRREGNGRYQIHELLRQYANEKLAASPERELAARRAHCKYFLQFLVENHPMMHDARQRQTVQKLTGDLENIRKAWQWAVDHLQIRWLLQSAHTLYCIFQFQGRYLEGADLFFNTARQLEADRLTPDRGAALTEALCDYAWFCIRLGRLDDAERAVARARHVYDELGLSPRPYLEGYPHMPTMFLALLHGNYAEATVLGEQLLRVTMEHSLPTNWAIPHYAMASAVFAQGDYGRAKTYAERSLTFAAAAGNQRDKTFAHGILGQVALVEHDLPAAKRHFEAAYTICNDYADLGGVAEHLANLASVALLQQEWREARTYYARSFKGYEGIGDQGGMARTRLGIGIVSQKTNEAGAARLHYGHALTVAHEAQLVPVILSIAAVVGDFLLQSDHTQALGLRALTFVLQHPSCDGQTRNQALESLARIGRSAHELSVTPDTLMSLIDELQAELVAPEAETSTLFDLRAQPLAEPLTAREIEVLHLLASGQTNPEIAEVLVVTVGTVKSHTSRIYRKLDVTNRTQAVLRGRELGFLA